MSNARSSALLWSVIAAAFVGPGTVATATKAGSEGGVNYLLPLIGALLAGYLLMEMAARVTLITGKPLGNAVRKSLGDWVTYLLFGGILLGCCAYEAGNLLGGFAGLELFSSLNRWWVILIVLFAAILLFSGNEQKISRALSIIVVVMGCVFLFAGFSAVLGGDAPPKSTSLSTTTVLAIFGTTIVPYNFMLAAGLGQGQQLGAMRSGLGISFLVGGLITLGILLTGTIIPAFTDFAQLGTALEQQVGSSGKILLGIGLFAAGFSSAITAPLAAAVAGKTLFANDQTQSWAFNSTHFRATWGGVLVVGLLVSVLDLNIVPVILAAQFVNALLLPFLAALVLYLANRHDLLGEAVNQWWQNALGLLVFTYLAYKSALGLLGLTSDVVGPWWLVVLIVLLATGLAIALRRGQKC